MLHVDVSQVAAGQVRRLREWARELDERVDEVRATFEREGTRSLQMLLVETSDGYLLISVADVLDIEVAREVVRTSDLPVDLEHRRVMSTVVDRHLDVEVLLHLEAL